VRKPWLGRCSAPSTTSQWAADAHLRHVFARRHGVQQGHTASPPRVSGPGTGHRLPPALLRPRVCVEQMKCKLEVPISHMDGAADKEAERSTGEATRRIAGQTPSRFALSDHCCHPHWLPPAPCPEAT
jgi:hypothetical protein